MKITIHNMHDEEPRHAYDFRVDRSTPLGNSYWMRNESQRRYACKQYEERTFPMWLRENRRRQMRYLDEIYDALVKHDKVRLFCWCVPKQCHAETIKKYLLRRLERESLT